MARELIDLLWRDHPDAPRGGSRGPRAKVTTSRAVDTAVGIADAEGLDAVTIRRLAADLGVSAMALYTHVGSRDDLLVLMVDRVHARQPRPPYPSSSWRERVRQVAETELAHYAAHAWLLDVDDQRTALGPGTIAKYDHELHAFDGTGLTDVQRDAALTFVADFVRAAARARRPDPHAADMAETWARWNERLAHYLGDAHPLAQRVGGAAGEAMNATYSPDHAWTFGLQRVLDGLDALVAASVD
ncbi:TetR/AcrR family transcriptional regulator C-terminal domain-containing protein [Rhodococcus sp. Z13]|uniref:TetR/AcrR family transcriptional regulator C-terminal domain-containing protein n=1 Tax=Rhodococcus sacchari TaxID=2962047 RepID=A0ACD4DC36_9NOCA|nr:TetR/AcrR family transcriptional regulator C-terminal domain-containing protein [Rhodococcus sp. Z13]UYP17551.1 TetR/AcrR family transcriptional regulator C-terminal domain-containing protein [Rhodococcus sp. Z13]